MRISKKGIFLFMRHQMGGAAASAVDLGTMTLGVKLFELRPSVATAIGAFVGGVTNFLLARHLIFKAQSGAAWHQALRYASVSATSLLLNASGEWLLAERLHIQYFLARLLISGFVSFAWNFPMHRYFVFAAPKVLPGPEPRLPEPPLPE